MKSVGLIVEYNPFHNGHKYHVKKAKEQTNADVVIAIMSGNFLQRGEPAIIDKWQRAKAALLNGVDLVIELPVKLAVQSADYFAKGSIYFLQKLGVKTLVFGTDVALQKSVDYEAFGRQAIAKQKEIEKYFKKLKGTKQRFSKQMSDVYCHFFPEVSLNFTSPNHLLGLAYARENAKYQTPMKIIAIPRIGSNFHEIKLSKNFASAAAIRKNLLAGEKEKVRNMIPSTVFSSLHSLICWEDYFKLLKYHIISVKTSELSQIYQMNEGFEYRLQEKIKEADSFADLVNQLKTKRYTYTRIQRLLTYVLLNIKKEDFRKQKSNMPFHILGFTDQGRKFLKIKKQKSNILFISKIGRLHIGMMSVNLKADAIYQMASFKIPEQNYGRIPIYSGPA
ncbi:MAG: nucleotidyltransferase [Streptococcaceae bacterium]|jgi:predicted nucleotidyltransferase|nr:nucleotidyltransferase [Streptococcaceae bacterium]